MQWCRWPLGGNETPKLFRVCGLKKRRGDSLITTELFLSEILCFSVQGDLTGHENNPLALTWKNQRGSSVTVVLVAFQGHLTWFGKITISIRAPWTQRLCWFVVLLLYFTFSKQHILYPVLSLHPSHKSQVGPHTVITCGLVLKFFLGARILLLLTCLNHWPPLTPTWLINGISAPQAGQSRLIVENSDNGENL